MTKRRRPDDAGEPTTAAPKVGLFGLIGQGNLGNDGSMEAVLAYLRGEHPDISVDALCSGPDVVSFRYGIRATPLRWYQPKRERASGVAARARRCVGLGSGVVIDTIRTASWARRHDAVIVPGMGVLETTVPMRPWKTPFSMFLLSAVGRAFNTKIVLLSVGANVTGHRVTRSLITSAVRHAHYRSYRDVVSKDAMGAMGLDTSADAVYPDVAHALSAPGAIEPVPGSVGIGVMDYSGGNDDLSEAAELRANYLQQMKLFARWVVDSGRTIRLFTSDTADEPVVRSIAADVRAYRPDLGPSWVIAEPAPSLDELLDQIASVDTVVATRYHNVLYSLVLGKPTLALGYAAKHDRLMAEAGLPGFCLPCKTLDVAQIIERFTDLEAEAVALRQAIAESNAAKVRLVKQQFAELSRVVFSPTEAALVSTIRAPANTTIH